ncbi:MAG: 16S rRNA (cytidine(1402)-2'-O)-methyltransferase [Sulfurospirillum sp.]|nr:MAG: 16S rRNA (cytidine(1402)-2'-O)-methyltransferase [Sulfurospirillum sp.]
MLYFIPTPIGNLEDISLRSLNILAKSSLVFCEDTRVAKKLINLLQKNSNLDFIEKNFISMHSHNEERVIKELNKETFDQTVVYLSDAGMPCVSDPGCKLVEYAQKNSIEYEVLPGANAALLAYAASGFCQKEFLFFGFLSHKTKSRNEELQKLINSSYTTILYESPHRIKKLIDELSSLIPNHQIFLAKELTKMYELKLKGTAKEIKENFKDINTKGEWVVVVSGTYESTKGEAITIEDILSLDIPKKAASKLIAKLTGENPKECYKQLLHSSNPKG